MKGLDREIGGIRGGVESSEHPIEGSTSWQEPQTVLAYAPDHWSSYIYAGVAARAAFVLKMLNKTETARLWEESAVKAMRWAEVEYDAGTNCIYLGIPCIKEINVTVFFASCTLPTTIPGSGHNIFNLTPG